MLLIDYFKKFLNKKENIVNDDIEKYWIVKTRLGFGVATVCTKPKGVKNKYHIAYHGIMTIDFIDDIESIAVKEKVSFELDGFNKNKLKNILEKKVRYDLA